ncbi:MAG: GTPase HflX [Actinomycetes bacterium]|jgi:GTP-binding protein HflX|nr:GTPase HflX [Acidimicrobiia bacterium]
MTEAHVGRSGRRLTATVTDLEVARQKAFLIGVVLPGDDREEARRSLDELARLTDTAGSDPVDSELVTRARIDPATYIGSGKAAELAEVTRALDIDVVVFDNPLTPAQQRNLQKVFECDVVDREAVILDIFAANATTRQGVLQVELALYRYNLPRLRGKGRELSQQAGGIGAKRGPGETKLETDRRRIQARITRLQRELEELNRRLETQRKARKRNAVPHVALVGYTNAGKSTLLNRLTDADVLTQDRLFSTLDATVRKLPLEGGPQAVISDTVGFVRRLPHDLVEAFRSTLVEVKEADLLLHVVDASDTDPQGQIAAVREVLVEIEAHEVPELLVFNKIDIADEVAVRRLRELYPDALFISAREGEGIEELRAAIADALSNRTTLVHLQIPYDRGDVVASAYRLGEVVAVKHEDEGTLIDVRLPPQSVAAFAEFATS